MIFHSKVVNDKNEANGASGVSKETGGRRFEKIKGRHAWLLVRQNLKRFAANLKSEATVLGLFTGLGVVC